MRKLIGIPIIVMLLLLFLVFIFNLTIAPVTFYTEHGRTLFQAIGLVFGTFIIVALSTGLAVIPKLFRWTFTKDKLKASNPGHHTAKEGDTQPVPVGRSTSGNRKNG